ncbi:MAG: LptA/OstA family protein [Paracoccaceae bacterium]
MQFFKYTIVGFFLSVLTVSAQAQGTEVAFGGLQHDTTQPVEVSADQLKIDQATGTASFSGNVLIGQGELRLSAAEVLVEYAAPEGDATGQISRLLASGGVTLITGGNEAAEAQKAEYSIDNGTIILSGNVILTQGVNALSSERMVVNLGTGQATLEGRVRTIFQTGKN